MIDRRSLLRLVPQYLSVLALSNVAKAKDDPAPEDPSDPKAGQELVPVPRDIRLLELPAGVGAPAVALDAHGEHVVAGGSDGRLRRWDAATRRPLSTFEAHRYPIGAIALSPDGARAVTSGPSRLIEREDGLGRTAVYDGAVLKVWDLGTGRLIADLEPTAPWDHPVLDPDGPCVLFANRDGLNIWDLDSGRVDVRPADVPGGWNGPGLASASADTRRIAGLSSRRVGEGFEAAVGLWDVPAGRARVLDLGDQLGVSLKCPAISPDGRRIVVGHVIFSSDPSVESHRRLTVIDCASGAVVRHLQTRPGQALHLHFLAFLRDSWIVSASDDRSPAGREVVLRVWDAESGRETAAFRAPRGWVRAVTLLRDGRLRVVSGGLDTLADESGQQIGLDPLKIWEADLPKPP